MDQLGEIAGVDLNPRNNTGVDDDQEDQEDTNFAKAPGTLYDDFI